MFKLAEVQATEVKLDHIGDVMVIMLTSSPVDHGSKPLSGQSKDYEIGILCFIANQNNIFEWISMLFQWASSINIQLSMLVLYKADIILIFSSSVTWSRQKIAHFH